MPISRRTLLLAPVVAAAGEVVRTIINPLVAQAQTLGMILPVDNYQRLPQFAAFRDKVFGEHTKDWHTSISIIMVYSAPGSQQPAFRPAGVITFVTDPATNTRHGYSMNWWPDERHFYQVGDGQPVESNGSLTIFSRQVNFAEVRVLAGKLTRAVTEDMRAKAGRRPQPK